MSKRPSTSQGGTSSGLKRPPLTRSRSDSETSVAPAKGLASVPAKVQTGTTGNGSTILVKKKPIGSEAVAVAQPTPSRPPRNPSRPSTGTTGQTATTTTSSKIVRPSTSSGAREEIVPWEFYPAPDYTAPSQIHTSTRPPPPTTTNTNSGIHLSDFALVKRRKSTGSKPQSKLTNTSTPHVPLARPAQETRSMFSSPSVMGSASKILPKATPTSPKLLPKAAVSTPAPLSPFVSPLPTTAQRQSVAQTSGPPKSSPLAPPKRDQRPTNLKFSTADRTILEELKRNITARASQFIFKGGPANSHDGTVNFGWGAQGIGAGKKHHPYPKEEVPYPRSYERDVLDLDVWETAFCQQLCGSLTYHVFDEPPSRVLDLGCGSGSWILNCARAWRQSSFVGLDVVPLHPDLQQVGSPDLASRITWVQANFLEGLPFPNEEFDFVHVKRISLGVPEDKWDALFEEITRVMKPGAAFEMIEEDLFFPGKSPNDDGDSGADTSSESRSSDEVKRSRLYRQSLPPSAFDNLTKSLERTDHDRDQDSDSPTASGSGGSRRNSSSMGGRPSDEFVWTPTTSTATDSSPIAPSSTPPRSASPIAPALREVDPIVEDVEGENLGTITASSIPKRILKSSSVVNLREQKAFIPARPPPPPPLRAQLAQPSQRTSAFHLPTRSQQPPGKFTGSAEWMMASLAPASSFHGNSLVGKSSMDYQHSFSTTQQSLSNPPSPETPVKRAPFLLRSIPRPPQNPRDHSLLALIYTEMCASRFINLSPLSLLANLLVLHFDDIRTHPPLQFTFPPRPKPPPTVSEPDSVSDEEARDAIIPNPPKQPLPSPEAATPRPTSSNTKAASYFVIPVSGDGDDEARFLSMRGLIQGVSQYVTLDDTRVSAFSPSKKATFSPPLKDPFKDTTKSMGMSGSVSEKTNGVSGTVKARAMSLSQNQLPNATMHMDLRTLNLHLAARASEILACSESMWEWVVAYQKTVRAKRAERTAKVTQRARAGSVETALHQRRAAAAVSEPSLKSAIEDLTREDFDTLLSRFAIDMRDHTALGPALQERFSWSVFPTSPNSERKMFNNEYSQWLQWGEENHHRNQEQPSRRPMSMVGSSSSSTLLDVLEIPNGQPLDFSAKAMMRQSVTKKPSSISTGSGSSTSTLTPPTRKLSRAMRVFVGWKPST